MTDTFVTFLRQVNKDNKEQLPMYIEIEFIESMIDEVKEEVAAFRCLK